ncbi:MULTISPECIES: septal ring lytic transglycosylase RlpA family protein [unclassified Pseudoalteromonas]|uniref:septal ring lytic transglycosylase RlpA family protein n=1 Tax=unclassified Pseudoalteromonas TaxID=194690 RepID=UPI002873029F|nr:MULTISPECIES: septal ring lytic transglycosylase RlpA family protein [unclassified Pseudoalteromonas]
MLIKALLISLSLAILAGCSSSQTNYSATSTGIREQGNASFYADKYHGRLTASGEKFDQQAMTAAHKQLPFNSKVKVTNTANNRSVVVRVNDRGPFIPGRIIDLTKHAFEQLAEPSSGVINVTVEVID